MLNMVAQDLKASPLRNTLTALSMLIGVLAVIASVLVGTVGRTYLEATNAQLSGRPPTYSMMVEGSEGSEAGGAVNLALALHEDDDVAAAAMLSGRGFSYTIPTGAWDSQKASAPESEVAGDGRVETLAVTWRYRDVFNLPLASGRWFTPPAAPAPLEVVVNKPAASMLGRPEASIFLSYPGTTIPSQGIIVGVVNDGSADPKAYLDLAGIATFMPLALDLKGMQLVAHPLASPLSVEDIKAHLADALTDTLDAKIGETVQIDNSESYRDVLRFLELAFALGGGLLLLVAAIGLLNVGLASIEQRARELLIRRAVGASRASLALLVTSEMLALSLLVCLFALALAAMLVASVPSLLPPDTPVEAPAFPLRAALAAIGASVLTALASAAIPAAKAARLEPALVLR